MESQDASARPGRAIVRAAPTAASGLLAADPWSPAYEGLSVSPALLFYWRVLTKHRWLILASLLIALAAGVAASLLMRPTFSAEAVVRIDRELEKIVGSEPVTSADNLGEEFFQTEYGMLRSRALAGRVAEALGLTRDDHFINTMTDHRAAAAGRPLGPTDRRDRVIDLLQGGQVVTPERGSRLVDVAFSSPDAVLSARIANAFAENFIASAVDRRFEASAYAREFLEKRIAQVRAKLEQSERDVVSYARSKQIIPLSGSGPTNDNPRSLQGADLESFNQALAQAKTDRIRAEQRWRQAQAAPGMGLSEVLQSPTIQELSKEHAKLASDLREKSNTYKAGYPDMVRLKSRLEEIDNQISLEVRNIRDSLHVQYLAALDNERTLAGQVSGLKTEVLDLRGRSIQYTILQREVDTNRTLYDGLLQRYKEVGVAGGVAASNIAIVDRAEAPKFPSSPNPLLNMALAAVVGLGVGLVLAFLREAFDSAIRAPADVEAKLGLPILGTAPALKSGQSPLIALGDPRSPLSEAYFSLRSALQFSTSDGFPRTLLVTSPWPGGGKSTTTLAVAQNLARMGHRVLMIDADLRSPSMHHLTGVENLVGLSSVLTGASDLAGAVTAIDLGNLHVMPSGPVAPNPAELLAGARLTQLVADAAKAFDYVLFDGPPIMGLADAPMLGAAVAGSLLVVQSRRTTRAQVIQAMRRMSMSNAHVLGVVLTRYSQSQSAYGYGYDYDYDYGSAAKGRGLSGLAARARRLVTR